MKDAKDCIRCRSTWLLACLGLCLSSLEMGCAGLSGLHSVGTWPPFAHMWERGPGSPAPENDTYAQVMRPSLGLNAKSAADETSGAGKSSSKGSATKGTGDTSSATGAAADGEAPSREQGAGRSGLQVTLGPPEPLPGVLMAARPEGSRSSAGGASSGWRQAGPERDPGRDSVAPEPVIADAAAERVPELAEEAPAVEPPVIAPALAAADNVPSHLALAGPSDTESTVPETGAEESPTSARADAKLILAQAVAKLARLDSYQVKMQRRERVGGVVQPEEDILLSIKRKPKAVRLEWIAGSSKGREVIFSPTLDAKMIYVHQPAAAVIAPSVKIAVDSPLVMKNSRHTIAEAGFETILGNLEKSQQGAAQGKPGSASLEYKGMEKTAGVDRPSHHFIRRTASGETWNIYLDPRSMLPRLVVAESSQGDLLERYVYSDIRENPTDLASAAAFDPSTRWGEGKGLFSRIAKAASEATMPGKDASTKR
jgi:Protein of unknown function (DUF1571)